MALTLYDWWVQKVVGPSVVLLMVGIVSGAIGLGAVYADLWTPVPLLASTYWVLMLTFLMVIIGTVIYRRIQLAKSFTGGDRQ